MTKTELLELVANGENSGVEFKSDVIDNRDLAKEIVALANLRGGVVLLGVNGDGTIGGVPKGVAALEEWVMQACRDKIRPELNPYFEVIRNVALGRNVVAVRVEQGWSVHHLWHNNHRTYYVRVGSTSREASPEELARLFQQRRGFRLETQAVSGTTIDDLDRRRLTDYFERVRGQSVPSAGRGSAWESLLTNTEIMGEAGSPTPATVAGLILFGTDPTRFLPQAKIDAVAYDGLVKDYDAGERRTLRGPVAPLMDDGGEVVEPGLVEQAIDFVRRNIATVHMADGIRRTRRWDYPVEVLREVIVNAVVHRDYLLSGTDIELSIYSDRLEVVSPGRLPNGVTPERMRAGCRSTRNELLKDVMRDYGYLEHMGMGVPRKIIRGMREHNATEPGLIEDEEQFTVRLWKGDPGSKQTESPSIEDADR